MNKLLKYNIDQTSRMAFAGLIHDLGKIGQRSQLEVSKEKKEYLDQLYSKRVLFKDSANVNYYTHQHVAYTGIMYDQIQKYIPKDVNESPFNVDSIKEGMIDIKIESLLNVAALHHKPDEDSLLQWIVAISDRVASGFERNKFEEYNSKQDPKEDFKNNNEEHYIKRRLLSILESIDIKDINKEYNDYKFRLDLKPLNAKHMMLTKKEDLYDRSIVTCAKEYELLWNEFIDKIKLIPSSHKDNWQLWLDHFDSLFSIYGNAVPASTIVGFNSDVSLYDHSKTTAAIATSLWCYYVMNDNYHVKTKQLEWINDLKMRSNTDEKQFIFIQGDFWGIQDYIFTDGNKVNKDVTKLLRGRSFSVSLFTDLIALKILNELQLPATSQVLNAAGKFLIIAPNNQIVKNIINEIEKEINQWFLNNTLSVNGFSLTYMEVGLNNFISGDKFNQLLSEIFINLERKKLNKYSDTLLKTPLFDIDYTHGVCDYNKYLPADSTYKSDSININKLSKLQIIIGEELVKKNRILVTSESCELNDSKSTKIVIENFLGFKVALTNDEDNTGKFSGLAKELSLIRCWDYSLPDENGNLWNGYSRKFINGHVAIWDENYSIAKYQDLSTDEIVNGNIKSWDFLACEDKTLFRDKEYIGLTALAVLKGDVDDLGRIFQKGIKNNCFAKILNVSRQINNFFSIYLPYVCNQNGYKNVYTVFAGGDDFFLIGSWKTIMELSSKIANDFKSYVGENEQLHFSASINLFKPGIPIHSIYEIAEQSLETAKRFEYYKEKPHKKDNELEKKNSLCVFGIPIKWNDYSNMLTISENIKTIANHHKLSTAYIYGLLNLCDMAANKKNPTNSMWYSYFKYRTYRLFENKEDYNNLYEELVKLIGSGINDYKKQFKIALMHYLYQNR